MRSLSSRFSFLAVIVGLAALAAPERAHTQDATAPAPARTEAEMRQLLDGAWYLVQPESTARPLRPMAAKRRLAITVRRGR